MFSSSSYIVYGLTFRSLIHFESILVYGVRKCSSFILLQVVDQFSQYHLLKTLSLIHCISLPPLSKIRCSQLHGFISGLSILFYYFIFLSLCQQHAVLMTVFVVDSEVRQVDSSSYILLSQNSFGYSRIFVFPYKLWNIICSSSTKNTVSSLIGIAVLLECSDLFCLRVLFGKPCIIIRALVS